MLAKLHRGQDYRSHPRQQGCLSKEQVMGNRQERELVKKQLRLKGDLVGFVGGIQV